MFTKEMGLAVLLCITKFLCCYAVGWLMWALLWVLLIRRPRRRT